MIVAGCDIGSLTAKVVLLKDDKIIAGEVIGAKSKPEESADEVMGIALSKTDLSLKDISYCVGTGYGRKQIPFVDEVMSEIACHGRGAKWLLPTVHTIIDIGGQDCKAIRIDDEGKIVKFIANDKCAAGTGRFLEIMAKLLEVKLGDLGSLSSEAKEKLELASNCTVWVQSEVIYHLNAKKSVADIGAAVNLAMAKRMAILVNSIGIEKELCMTGGVAKNIGVFKNLERELGFKIRKLRTDPQLVGAVGAAVYAEEKYMKKEG